MTTTDSNGLIQYQTTDNVVPLQTAFNGLSSSVSTALNSTVRTFKVANDTERNALATTRVPSATNPLVVFNSASGKGYQEINTGSGWSRLVPNEAVVYGKPMLGSTIGSPLIIQGGWAAVTTDGNGNANFSYPQAFPNGLISVVLTGFNYEQAGDRTSVLYATTVLDKCNFRVYQSNGSALPNTLCAWSWIAIGW